MSKKYRELDSREFREENIYKAENVMLLIASVMHKYGSDGLMVNFKISDYADGSGNFINMKIFKDIR